MARKSFYRKQWLDRASGTPHFREQMSNEEVRAKALVHRRAITLLTTLVSLLSWFAFAASGLWGGWASVVVAPTALRWAVSTLVFTARVWCLGANFLDRGPSAHHGRFLGSLAAGLWIARLPHPGWALIVLWGVAVCSDVAVFWNHEATNPETPGVSWRYILQEVMLSLAWTIAGTLAGFGAGRVLLGW